MEGCSLQSPIQENVEHLEGLMDCRTKNDNSLLPGVYLHNYLQFHIGKAEYTSRSDWHRGEASVVLHPEYFVLQLNSEMRYAVIPLTKEKHFVVQYTLGKRGHFPFQAFFVSSCYALTQLYTQREP